MIKHSCAILLIAAVSTAAQPSATLRPPISLTETAATLAENGAANGNARAVMVAAEILRVVERGSPRVQRIGPVTGPAGSWDGPMTSASLFRLASRIATDRGDMTTASYVAWLAQIPDSVPVMRGATGGPVWADAYLGRGQETSYSIEFTGGQTPNALRVSAGKAGSAIECTLHEGANPGPVAARAKSLAGTCSIEWRQAKTGRMTLRIRNAGSATYLVVSTN